MLDMDQLRTLALVCATTAWCMEFLKQRSDAFKRIMFQVGQKEREGVGRAGVVLRVCSVRGRDQKNVHRAGCG